MTSKQGHQESDGLTYGQFSAAIARDLGVEAPAADANIWRCLDSLQLYELICILEDEYQAQLPLVLWETFETFQDVFEHCELRLNQQQGASHFNA